VCLSICKCLLMYVFVWGGRVCACVSVSLSLCVCLLAVYNKAQAQIISNREFNLWTFLQRTESRGPTFLPETCVMPHQSQTSRFLYAINMSRLHESGYMQAMYKSRNT